VQIYQSFGYYLIQIFPEFQTNGGDNLQKSKVVKNDLVLFCKILQKKTEKKFKKEKKNG
jgi:hypothetical protein